MTSTHLLVLEMRVRVSLNCATTPQQRTLLQIPASSHQLFYITFFTPSLSAPPLFAPPPPQPLAARCLPLEIPLEAFITNTISSSGHLPFSHTQNAKTVTMAQFPESNTRTQLPEPQEFEEEASQRNNNPQTPQQPVYGQQPTPYDGDGGEPTTLAEVRAARLAAHSSSAVIQLSTARSCHHHRCRSASPTAQQGWYYHRRRRPHTYVFYVRLNTVIFANNATSLSREDSEIWKGAPSR